MTPAPEIAVVHVVDAEVSAERFGALQALCRGGPTSGRQLVVQIGAGPGLSAAGVRPIRVHAPLESYWLGTGALQHALEGRGLLAGDRPMIFHAWSPTALDWCVPIVAAHRPLLVDFELGPHLPRRLRWIQSEQTAARVVCVCPTMTVLRRLREQGLSADCCALIPPFVDFEAFDGVRRTEVRARLGLNDYDVAIMPLPPIARQTGAFVAAWAAMLLDKVRPDVRLIVPAGGAEAERIRRLVEACRHAAIVRFARPALGLPDLLAAADLAAFLPAGDAPMTTVLHAMATGRPLVAAAVPAVTEFLVHGETGWLCGPNDPEDAARRMLQVIEQPGESRRRAEQARARVAEGYSRQRMIEDYRAIYAHLPARAAAGSNR